MNAFLQIFGSSMQVFWKMKTEDEKQNLLHDILVYANRQPQSFKKDVFAISLEQLNSELSVVLESLSKDTQQWGDFVVELLEHIFKTASHSANPKQVLDALMEFAYFEKDTLPYVQKLVDRMFEETKSPQKIIQRHAIWYIVQFLKNPMIENRQIILQHLHTLLKHRSSQIRIITFRALSNEDLVPPNFQLSPLDRIRYKYLNY